MRLLRAKDGDTVTELALILPVFLLILFGIVEGSQILGAWVILTNETRQAARYGVAGVRDGDSNLTTEVQAQFGTDVKSLLPGAVTTTVTVAGDGIETTAVTVTANYSVALQTPFTQAAMGASVPIQVTSTMRAE